MYISMPRDFFVPVMYDYKENLNLIDEESETMYREDEESVNAQYQKALEGEDATYVDKCNEDTIGKEEVNKEYYEALEDKEATYNKSNIYKLMDDEYIDSAISDDSKYKNKSCNRL